MKDMPKQISPQQLLYAGMNQIAYIRQSAEGFEVHAADGSPMVTLDSLPDAMAAVRQYDMHPVTVH